MPYMKEGIKLHKEREMKEAKKAEFIQMTTSQIEELLKVGEEFEFKMEGDKAALIHNSFHYVGRMDKIKKLTKRSFTIEEFKTQNVKGNKVYLYDGYYIQALTYALMASKKYGAPVTKGNLLFIVKDRNTKLIVCEEEEKITKKHIAKYYATITRFENLYLGKAKPVYHGSKNKCIACNPAFKNVCEIGKQFN